MPRLDIDLVANLASLQRDMERAVGIVDKGFRDMKRAGETVRNLLGVLGVGVGVGAFVSFIKAQIDAADALNDLSKRLNVSVENLAGFKLVAEQSGASLESLATAFRKLQVNLVSAETNREIAQTLQILGITARDPTQAMLQLADAFKALGDRPERTAAAIKLLGKSGDEIIPALAGGSAEIEKMMRRGQELSGITAENARRADEFNDKLAELKTTAGGLAQTVLSRTLPALTRLAEVAQLELKTGNLAASIAGVYAKYKTENKLFLEQQKKDLDTIFTEGAQDIFAKYLGGAKRQFPQGERDEGADSGEDIAKKLALAAEFDELSKKVVAIQVRQQDEQTRLATKYADDYQTLTRARAAGVIATDRQLNIERLALATQHEQDLADLEAKRAGDNKLADRLAAERAQHTAELESRLESVRLALASQTELEDNEHARRVATLYEANQTIVQIDNEGQAQRLLGDAEFYKLRELAELQHRARMGDIEAQAELERRRQAQLSWTQRLAEMQKGFALLVPLMQSKHKAIFEIGKASAIAQIAVAIPEGAVQAYKAMLPIPIVGPTLGKLAAAAYVGFSLERMAAIKATSFGGDATGGAIPTIDVSPSTGLPVGTPGGGNIGNVGATVPVPEPEGRPLEIIVNLDGQPILSTVQRATDDGRIIINAHAVR